MSWQAAHAKRVVQVMDTFYGIERSTILDFAGLTGVVFYIGSYAGLQTGLLKGNGYAYTIFNLLAAGLVLLSLTNDFNLSSAIIQATWIGISIIGLTRVGYLNAVTRLNAEEAYLIKEKLPGMPKPMARKFFNAGVWLDAEIGTTVASEGSPVGALYFLSDGETSVTIGDEHIGTSKPATFIGEMTCFDAAPATATVTVSKPARFFRIGTESLNMLCRKDSDLKMLLENSLAADTRLKLVEANAQITGKTQAH